MPSETFRREDADRDRHDSPPFVAYDTDMGRHSRPAARRTGQPNFRSAAEPARPVSAVGPAVARARRSRGCPLSASRRCCCPYVSVDFNAPGGSAAVPVGVGDRGTALSSHLTRAVSPPGSWKERHVAETTWPLVVGAHRTCRAHAGRSSRHRPPRSRRIGSVGHIGTTIRSRRAGERCHRTHRPVVPAADLRRMGNEPGLDGERHRRLPRPDP